MGNTRKEIEADTGKPVISKKKDNIDLSQLIAGVIEEAGKDNNSLIVRRKQSQTDEKIGLRKRLFQILPPRGR